MIIVDSSVWIGHFRNDTTSEVGQLRDLFGRAPILMGDMILLEVLQGARSDVHAAWLKDGLAAFETVTMLGPAIAERAALHYRRLRTAGITVRKTPDLIIASFCVAHGHTLLHADRDFTAMQPILGLRTL